MGKDEWEAVEGGFVHGIDLVNHIRAHHGDYFDVAVAGFPQQVLLPPEELAQELLWLKEKIDAGANFIFTQMFYDVELFIAWVKAVRAAGITVPIVPGVAPIQTWNGFIKSTTLSCTSIPQALLDQLEPYKNNDEKVRELGTKLVGDMCRRILNADLGIKGLHFYTMNLEKGTRMLLEELKLVPRVEVVKPLPWRQVSDIRTCVIYHETNLFISRSPQVAVPKPSVLSSGRTGHVHTYLVRRTGTNTPTDVLVTLVLPPTASWTAMVFGSSRRYVLVLYPLSSLPNSSINKFVERASVCAVGAAHVPRGRHRALLTILSRQAVGTTVV